MAGYGTNTGASSAGAGYSSQAGYGAAPSGGQAGTNYQQVRDSLQGLKRPQSRAGLRRSCITGFPASCMFIKSRTLRAMVQSQGLCYCHTSAPADAGSAV